MTVSRTFNNSNNDDNYSDDNNNEEKKPHKLQKPTEEFTCEHMISCSDCQSWTTKEVLAAADAE